MVAPHSSSALEKEVRIRARPETIFPFFTDPEKMMQWKGIDVTLDPRPGGIYRVNMNGRNVAWGEYLELVSWTRVVFSWGWEGEDRRKHRSNQAKPMSTA